jgi:hypothetical protein
MMTIPELISAWRAKKLSGLALMRGLVSHPAWEIPISEKATAEALADNAISSLQVSTGKDGKTCLMLFSDVEAYKAYSRANAITTEQHFLKTDGTFVFRLPMDEVDQIWIDALTPHDIYYEKAQFNALRDMANAVVVEEALAGLRRGDAPKNAFATVKSYGNYYMATMQRDGKPVFLPAPDDKGRNLAAVFTADDSFDAFAAQAMRGNDGLRIQQMQLNGTTLFDSLRRMTIDGFVFNCAGPITPVAFAQAVAGIVLEN